MTPVTGCVGFAEDPIGLLPPRLILGINKRGVHFFRPVPKEYLHSAELRDIMQVHMQAVIFILASSAVYLSSLQLIFPYNASISPVCC